MTCFTDKDACVNNPCANNGQCVKYFHQYVCQCSRGFNGPTCEGKYIFQAVNEGQCEVKRPVCISVKFVDLYVCQYEVC